MSSSKTSPCQQFEQWAVGLGMSIERITKHWVASVADIGKYHSQFTQDCWLVWEAATTVPATEIINVDKLQTTTDLETIQAHLEWVRRELRGSQYSMAIEANAAAIEAMGRLADVKST